MDALNVDLAEPREGDLAKERDDSRRRRRRRARGGRNERNATSDKRPAQPWGFSGAVRAVARLARDATTTPCAALARGKSGGVGGARFLARRGGGGAARALGARRRRTRGYPRRDRRRSGRSRAVRRARPRPRTCSRGEPRRRRRDAVAGPGVVRARRAPRAPATRARRPAPGRGSHLRSTRESTTGYRPMRGGAEDLESRKRRRTGGSDGAFARALTPLRKRATCAERTPCARTSEICFYGGNVVVLRPS